MTDHAEARASRAGSVWLRVCVAAILAAALIAPLLIWREEITQVFATRERVVAELRGAGPWGPLLLIALVVAQTIVAPIPGQVVNLVGGYVFGLARGLLYSWAGMMLGTSLAMGLARCAGRPVVARLVDRQLLERLDRLAAGRGLRFFFLFFLIPGLPDDVLCFIAGLTPLPLRVLILLSAVARFPGIFASVWLGTYAERLPWPVWGLIGSLGLAALWVVWKHGDRVQDTLLKLTTRADRSVNV